ncbi:hypothetical protein Tco_0620315 [Tanacetum coccineum]
MPIASAGRRSMVNPRLGKPGWRSSVASAKLTRAELNKRSGDADLSKDKSGPELPPEFRSSWRRRTKLRRNQAELDIYHRRVERLCENANTWKRVQGAWKELQWRQREEQMSRIREQVILRARSNSGKRPSSGATLTTNCKQLLAGILRENIEVFLWTGSESTAIPRFVMEHQLKIYPLAKPVVHKRRPVAPEGRLAIKERVFHWLGEGLIRKVRHLEWITNTIPIKLANGTWKVQVDYSGLNKACSKDMYPFPEEGEELASSVGYPYKCFLRILKEYSQIRMVEDDEEKTGFHTEEGVYCFTRMPKELKNSTATLQRIMEKVLADQRGRNVEIH